MKILKPYETTTGKMTNTTSIVNELNKFLVEEQIAEDLSYEFYNGDTDIYIITGCTDAEKSLPTFEFPIYFQNVRRKDSVAIDLRPYVASNKLVNFKEIKDIVKDKYSANFLIFSMLLGIRFNYSTQELKPISTNLITAFSMIISNSVTKMLTITPVDRLYLEIATSVYCYTLLFPENNILDDEERIINIINNCKLTYPTDKKIIKERFNLLHNNPEIVKLYGIPLLTELLKTMLPEDLVNIVTIQGLYSTLSNSWFGPGGSKSIYIGLESMVVFIPLVYSCIESSMFKNTIISRIIDSNKRKIDTNNINNYISNVLTKKDLGELL